jgi:hypothetical protein|tara:strand:- start:5515 stop:6513 length:999 start_codon:yes stop_codon:yes gene_type:complete
MSTEPSLLQNLKKEKAPKKWCVYYDDDSGEVITVTNRVLDEIKSPHFFTENDDARKILMGIQDPKKFSILETEDSFILAEKSAVLRIKEAEQSLSMIPVNDKTKADVNIIMYINSWKMEVNFDQDTLYKMTGKRYFKQATINPEKDGKYDNITLYIIKDKDPNFLIKKIDIDPGELVEQGYLLFDMSAFRNVCGLGEMSILTKKIFKTYRVTKKATFVGADYTSRRSIRRRHIIPQISNSEVLCDFTIISKDNSFSLRSNFKDPSTVKIYNDVGLYVTDKNDPNRLLGTLMLPKKDIGYNVTLEIESELDLKNSAFLLREENRNTTFDITES